MFIFHCYLIKIGIRIPNADPDPETGPTKLESQVGFLKRVPMRGRPCRMNRSTNSLEYLSTENKNSVYFIVKAKAKAKAKAAGLAAPDPATLPKGPGSAIQT